MAGAATSQKRKDRRVKKALDSNASVRKGTRAARFSKSEFQRKRQHLRDPKPRKLHNKRAFNDAEESVICEVIMSYADLSKPCTRYDEAYIVMTFIETLPEERKNCNRVVGGAVRMGRGRLCVTGSRSVVGEYRLGFEVVRCKSGSRVSRMTSHLERWRLPVL